MRIQLQDVKKSYNNQFVLNGVSLDIREGEFVALLGPSGCGKTTLLNAIAGLIDLTSGHIKMGDSLWSSPGYTLSPEKRNIGMVFQDFALWPHLNVFDNIAFGLKLRKYSSNKIKARVSEALDMVQMTGYSEYFPHQLSGGQKQRIAIARALAPRPDVMLMDEPLSSLDAKLREQMRWDLLKVTQQAGITTIYVTHDQVEALSMADRVVLLHGGKVEQEGKPIDLYRYPTTDFAATFVGASNLVSGKVIGQSGTSLSVDCDGKEIQSCFDENHVLVGKRVKLMFRPQDIEINVSYGSKANGTSLPGTIVQRAYHGVTWQYRVSVPGWSREIEVWDETQRAIGDDVTLWISAANCRMVAETQNSIAVV